MISVSDGPQPVVRVDAKRKGNWFILLTTES